MPRNQMGIRFRDMHSMNGRWKDKKWRANVGCRNNVGEIVYNLILKGCGKDVDKIMYTVAQNVK